MNLYKEILLSILENEECHVVFPNAEESFSQLVEMKSYEMLKKNPSHNPRRELRRR